MNSRSPCRTTAPHTLFTKAQSRPIVVPLRAEAKTKTPLTHGLLWPWTVAGEGEARPAFLPPETRLAVKNPLSHHHHPNPPIPFHLASSPPGMALRPSSLSSERVTPPWVESSLNSTEHVRPKRESFLRRSQKVYNGGEEGGGRVCIGECGSLVKGPRSERSCERTS